MKQLKNGDERVAYAIINYTNQQAIEWELATRAVQELKRRVLRGITGMGCFMDAEICIIFISL